METQDIKLKCLDFATRGAGVNGFVPTQIVKQAEVFYDWVTEGGADNQDKTRVKPKVTRRKRG